MGNLIRILVILSAIVLLFVTQVFTESAGSGRTYYMIVAALAGCATASVSHARVTKPIIISRMSVLLPSL